MMGFAMGIKHSVGENPAVKSGRLATFPRSHNANSSPSYCKPAYCQPALRSHVATVFVAFVETHLLKTFFFDNRTSVPWL